jgi:alpha-tubulin suppressor-like RCC1 family protein
VFGIAEGKTIPVHYEHEYKIHDLVHLTNIDQVSSGENHLLVRLSNLVLTYGNDGVGQCGSGEMNELRINKIIAGGNSSYLIDINGFVYVCGSNSFGQLYV